MDWLNISFVRKIIALLAGIFGLFASLSVFSYYGFVSRLPHEVRHSVGLLDFQPLVVRATAYFVASVMLARFSLLFARAIFSTSGSRLFAELGWKNVRTVIIVTGRFLKRGEPTLILLLSCLFFSFAFFSGGKVAFSFLTDFLYLLLIYYAISAVYFRRWFVTFWDLKVVSKQRLWVAFLAFATIGVPYFSYLLGYRILQDVERFVVQIHTENEVIDGAILLKLRDGLLILAKPDTYVFVPTESIDKVIFR